MSVRNEIEYGNWLTSREAARISGYNPAYLTRLAKKGQVLSRKSGRVWQIDYVSLKEFIASRDKTNLERQEELRLERLTERNGQTIVKSPGDSLVQVSVFRINTALASLSVLMLGGILGVLFNAIDEANLASSDAQAGINSLADSIRKSIPISTTLQAAAPYHGD